MRFLLSFVIYLIITVVITTIGLSELTKVKADVEAKKQQIDSMNTELTQAQADLQHISIDDFKNQQLAEIEKTRADQEQQLLTASGIKSDSISQIEKNYQSQLSDLNLLGNDEILNRFNNQDH